MIVSLGSAGQISGREYCPDTHLSQTLTWEKAQKTTPKIVQKFQKIEMARQRSSQGCREMLVRMSERAWIKIDRWPNQTFTWNKNSVFWSSRWGTTPASATTSTFQCKIDECIYNNVGDKQKLNSWTIKFDPPYSILKWLLAIKDGSTNVWVERPKAGKPAFIFTIILSTWY